MYSRDARDGDEADEAAWSDDNMDEDEEIAEEDEPDEVVEWICASKTFMVTRAVLREKYNETPLTVRQWNALRGRHRVPQASLPYPKTYATVVMAADRLVQEHIDSYGVDSLLTRSEEPFTTEELIALLKLPYGTRAGHLVLRDNLEWQGVQVMIALYCTMGPFKKPSPLTRARRSGRASYLYGTSPGGCSACCSERLHTVHNLMAIALGDMLYVTLCPCKSDPTGTKHGNSPVPSACHPTRPINLAWEAACYEIIRQMPPAERKRAPLVLGPGGKSWSKVGLDTFKELIRHIASPESHRQLSVYSFR
ncbi:MAG: hypothetical protein SGPRY_012092, partial [Prymnesium sp.]